MTLPTLRSSLNARWGLVALAVVSAALLSTDRAAAQITNKALIGDAVSEPDSPRYSDVANAIERYGNRDFIAAQTFLDSAKRKDPKLPPVAVMLAKLHALAGNANAIRPALEECITEAPDDPEPYLILAEEAMRAGRTIEADALFDKAVMLMQKYDMNAKRKRDFIIRAYSGRTRIAQVRKKWAQAESDLNELLKADPENSGAYYALGQVAFVKDSPDAKQGIASFNKARELNKDLEHPYVAAGKVYVGQGKLDEAMKYFEGAYKAEPKDASAQLAYSQALLQKGDTARSTTVLDSALKQNPGSANLWLLSGVAARMAGDDAKAEQQFMRAISLSPASVATYDQLAMTLIDSKDEEDKRRALGFAATAQKISPEDANANIVLAWTLFQNGNARQATSLLQNLQMRNIDPDAAMLLAKVLIMSNQKEGAKKLLNQALEDKRSIFVKRDEAQKLLETL